MPTVKGSKQVNYAMISLLQYLFAILVMVLHAQRIFSDDVLHFVQKSIFSRMAVPFFLLTTSFFLHWKEEQGQDGLAPYLQKSCKTYLLISLLYVPYAVAYFLSTGYAVYYLPLGLVLALTYVGMCYQLWYFPASFFGLLFLRFLRQRLSQRAVFLLCLALYLMGCLETYSAYLGEGPLLDWYTAYKTVFLTTRNGLFYVPMFLLLGRFAVAYRHHPILTRRPVAKLLLSFLLLLGEGVIIYVNQGDDKNFFLSLLPFSLFLFNWAAWTPVFRGKDWHKLKKYSG